MNRAKGKIKLVQVRHEEMAAFMASAYTKFSGQMGVCMATSGPGATHLITGMYDARLDHMPLLAIAGQQARWPAVTISKRSIFKASTRMSRARSYSRPALPLRCGISWIAPFASREASGGSQRSSCQTICRMSRMRNHRANTARFIQGSD